jgi:hypothetical protein
MKKGAKPDWQFNEFESAGVSHSLNQRRQTGNLYESARDGKISASRNMSNASTRSTIESRNRFKR